MMDTAIPLTAKETANQHTKHFFQQLFHEPGCIFAANAHERENHGDHMMIKSMVVYSIEACYMFVFIAT